MTTHEQLQAAMDFDHVVEVHADGTVTNAPSGLYAPDMCDDQIDSHAPWTLMDGYSGPTMHASEFIGGRLATDILARPGYYVAIVSRVTCDDACEEDCDDDIAGWAIAYLPSPEVEHEDETDCPAPKYCRAHSWTVT